ncbi:MAG: ABC transporter ATP-binding protein [Bryobacteraceae bacterium]|nr:ABC transporter ATP-binding protein [Bryobacteraceae bacterium]
MLEARDVVKEYATPRGGLRVLDGVSLTLEPGQACCVMGPSGSGKSTLLHILGALDRATSGSVRVDGVETGALAEAEVAAFRNERVGFVFQDHCLLPQLSVLENVLTATLVGKPEAQARERARELLEQVGLADRLEHKPTELSGGEKQRVAIARALIRHPLLLLCDEPTGNLDRKSAAVVADLLLDLHGRLRNILVVVTHSVDLAGHFEQRYEMDDGRLQPLR